MKKSFRITLFILLVVNINYSFAQKIKRWSGEGRESSLSQDITVNFNDNIFDEYKWINPPLQSNLISFSESGNASFEVGGNTYSLNIKSKEMVLTTQNQETWTLSPEAVEDKYCHNPSALKQLSKTEQRWVCEWRTETYTVQVPKTRTIPTTTFVNGIPKSGTR